MIQDQGLTTLNRPTSVRWEAWALLTAAAVAVAVGTIARGMVGVTEWVFNADNLADSLPLALPFLVGAGVMVGAGRWAAGRQSLVIGAVLVALSGAMAVALDVVFTLMTTGQGLGDTSWWLPAFGILLAASSTIGFSALAIGIWRSGSRAWGGLRAAAALGVALVAALAAAGPLVTTALSLQGNPVSPYLVTIGLTSASVAATGALAIACIRAAPTRTPLPELLIAAGATIHAVVHGGWWWLLLGSMGPDGSVVDWLTLVEPVGNAALLAMAAGFASGALFWPAEDWSGA